MASRLSDRLVNGGRVSVDTMRAAIARQAVYGGALDTALLETDAIDETLLWDELGAATGLPLPEPALCENPVRCVNPDGSAIELDAAWSERAPADANSAVIAARLAPIVGAAARASLRELYPDAGRIWSAEPAEELTDERTDEPDRR